MDRGDSGPKRASGVALGLFWWLETAPGSSHGRAPDAGRRLRSAHSLLLRNKLDMIYERVVAPVERPAGFAAALPDHKNA